MVVLLLQPAEPDSGPSIIEPQQLQGCRCPVPLPLLRLTSFRHACKERRGLRWCMVEAADGGHPGRRFSG